LRVTIDKKINYFTCSETSQTFPTEWKKDEEGKEVYKVIVERPEVQNAIVDCLRKVANDILNMDVTEELESRSVVDRSDITKRMNEGTVNFSGLTIIAKNGFSRSLCTLHTYVIVGCLFETLFYIKRHNIIWISTHL